MGGSFKRAGWWLSVVLSLGLLVGALTALPVGAGAGDPVVLGQLNTSSERTTIRANTSAASLRVMNTGGGSALALVVDKGVAPLKVNSKTKVVDLNADRLDGRTSSYFAKRPRTVQRVVACGSTGFIALGSNMGYGTANLNVPGEGVHFVRVADGGNFFGDCVLDIPSGAIIIEARFVVWDADDAAEVSCSLFKVPLGGASAAIFTPVTNVLNSGVADVTGPGTVLATSTILDAAVKDGDAISADCWMGVGSVGIEGVAVTYQVRAVPTTNP